MKFKVGDVVKLTPEAQREVDMNFPAVESEEYVLDGDTGIILDPSVVDNKYCHIRWPHWSKEEANWPLEWIQLATVVCGSCLKRTAPEDDYLCEGCRQNISAPIP